jgi:hypothetical protein
MACGAFGSMANLVPGRSDNGKVIPTKGQSATDLSPRHYLQIRLQKEFRYLLTVALGGSHSIT